MKNFRHFAPSAAFFAQFFVRNWKIFGASRHLKSAMKIFTGVGKKKQGRNWHVLVWGGEKLELLAKIFTLGWNILILMVFYSILWHMFIFSYYLHHPHRKLKNLFVWRNKVPKLRLYTPSLVERGSDPIEVPFLVHLVALIRKTWNLVSV